MTAYVYLLFAIILEIVGTSFLNKTNGFTHLGYTLLVMGSYFLAFYGLSMAVKVLPVGVVYATWSGVGIVLVSIVATLFQNQKMDIPGIIGMIFIVIGVVLMNLVSNMAKHS